MNQRTEQRPRPAQLAAAVTLFLAGFGGLQMASAQDGQPLEIVGVSIEGERVVLRSSGRMGSITAAPVEQDRSVILILGHRPGTALDQYTSTESGLVEAVELRTETTVTSVFTKILIKTRSPARASVSITQDTATITMEPTESPLILPLREDLFSETEVATPSPDEEGLQVRTVAAVYLREGPGQRYGTVTVADSGQLAEVIGVEGSWRWLQLESGEQGWVHQDFVELDQDPLELQVPAEVGTTAATVPERAVSTQPTPARLSTSGNTIDDRVQALLGAFEDERSDLQDRLTGTLKEVDKLRSESYGLEEELRQARVERDQMQASLEAERSRDRGANGRLFAVEAELDTRTLQFQALQAEIASREDRMSDLLERTEASIDVSAGSEDDLLDRLTRVLAVLETRQRSASSSNPLSSSPVSNNPNLNSPNSSIPVSNDSTASDPVATPTPAYTVSSDVFTATDTTAPVPASEVTPLVPSGDVRSTVSRWADAWSQQDVERYLRFYSERFSPPGGTVQSDWLAERRLRVTTPSQISVAIEQLEIVELSPVEAHALFVQAYRAPSFDDRVRKRLEMQLEGASWKIVREVSLPLQQ